MRASPASRAPIGRHLPRHLHAPARIRVVILDEPRRRVRVEVLEELRVADVDLLLLDRGRDRNHDRELLRVALEVASHRQHGAVAVADERDLRRPVKELRVRLRDVEAAEGARPRRGKRARTGTGRGRSEIEKRRMAEFSFRRRKAGAGLRHGPAARQDEIDQRNEEREERERPERAVRPEEAKLDVGRARARRGRRRGSGRRANRASSSGPRS